MSKESFQRRTVQNRIIQWIYPDRIDHKENYKQNYTEGNHTKGNTMKKIGRVIKTAAFFQACALGGLAIFNHKVKASATDQNLLKP